VPPSCELGRLSMHVLGDASELRVVVIGDDRELQADSQARAVDMTVA